MKRTVRGIPNAITVVATLLLLSPPIAAQGLRHYALAPQRLFADLPAKSIHQVVQKWGSYVVLDGANHRVVFLNSAMQVERQIGKIGQALGEFYYPNDLAVDKDGYIYVRDSMNRRFQVFEWNGKPVGEFPNSPEAHGLAVNSRGEILLGQPQKGKLVTVYDRAGKQLRSFGELHKLSDFYGAGVADLDAQYKHAINRVKFAVDSQDNVYVGFMGAPVFQKYDANGRLLFEKKIGGPEAAAIVTGFQKDRKSPVRRGIDDIPTPHIITGLAVDNATGTLYVSFQWDRGWVYVANASGDGTAILEYPQRDLLVQNISLSEDGKALLAPRLSVVKFDEAYMFKLPSPIGKK